MFGVSLPELLVVFVVVLLLFGPDKLPEIARTIGRTSGMLRRHSDSLRREFYNAVYQPSREIEQQFREPLRDLRVVSNDSARTAPEKTEAEAVASDQPSPKT